MPPPETIFEYMSCHSQELGKRILQDFPALHRAGDTLSPRIDDLRRKPFPAQSVAIMGIAKRWEQRRTAAVVGEMGTGKTLISLGAIHVHVKGRRYNALAMVPPHLVEKTAREAFQTIPRIRVFMIDDLRNGGDGNAPHGINEVKLRKGEIVREGLHTTLTDLRRRQDYFSSRVRWEALCPEPCLFVVNRERMKLSYFWRDAYRVACSGKYRRAVVNPETGAPIFTDDGEVLLEDDFGDEKKSELIKAMGGHPCRTRYVPFWQADKDKIQRVAPIDFMKRYMRGFFDYAIGDEMHQLFGDTAQGNALGALVSCVDRIVGLTGTLMGGYAGDLFNFLYRFEAAKMKEKGYEWGSSGRSDFVGRYGVVEEITYTAPTDNACSDAKTTTTVRERPGASPLLFADFLMELCAFINLEDISEALPPYEESVVEVEMDEPLFQAYGDLQADIKAALKKNRKNRSVLSVMLHSLLLYPDHPFDIGDLYGTERKPGTKFKTRFLISTPASLTKDRLYAKERKLIAEIKQELAEGRRCQVYAVYTQKHDVTARLRQVLTQAGIKVAVLKPTVATHKREAWYREKARQGVQVVICNPRLVETGLDLLDFPTIIFYESGYSLHTLRQASRRSWRIGQYRPVRVKFFCYGGTMQTKCLRLMGKKLLTALMLEGKFSGEGLQDIDGAEDADMLAALARTLTEEGIGETADQVWKTLNQEHQRLMGSGPSVEEIPVGVASDVPGLDVPLSEPPEFTPASIPHTVGGRTGSVLIFGQPIDSLRGSRQRLKAPNPDQLSLFSPN